MGTVFAAVRPAPYFVKWTDLISHRPPIAVQQEMLLRFSGSGQFHRIEAAAGDINIDKYIVFVPKLPEKEPGKRFTAEELLQEMRLRINDFLDSSIAFFAPYFPKHDPQRRTDELKWGSASPLSAVVSIDMLLLGTNPDSGSVVCSLHERDRWIFSTLHTPEDFAHPVAGNREFGFYPARMGQESGHAFYIRGADRITHLLDVVLEGVIFGSADNLWKSWQRQFAQFVVNRGGRARVLNSVSRREDWERVRSLCFKPTVAIATNPAPFPAPAPGTSPPTPSPPGSP